MNPSLQLCLYICIHTFFSDTNINANLNPVKEYFCLFISRTCNIILTNITNIKKFVNFNNTT